MHWTVDWGRIVNYSLVLNFQCKIWDYWEVWLDLSVYKFVQGWRSQVFSVLGH
jgi:hypothetical protein